jgi:hypothetical protein
MERKSLAQGTPKTAGSQALSGGAGALEPSTAISNKPIIVATVKPRITWGTILDVKRIPIIVFPDVAVFILRMSQDLLVPAESLHEQFTVVVNA